MHQQMSIKVSVYIATSLDGFIARNDSALDWLNEANATVPNGEDCGFHAFIDSVDALIMGRKTYDSIGRPLPGRLNIILSRDTDLEIEGCTVVNSLTDALKIAKQENNNSDNPKEEIFITGGAHLYNKFISEIDTLYLTQIDAEIEGDTFFPDYTKYNWKEAQRIERPADESNQYALTFLKLERLRTEEAE